MPRFARGVLALLVIDLFLCCFIWTENDENTAALWLSLQLVLFPLLVGKAAGTALAWTAEAYGWGRKSSLAAVACASNLFFLLACVLLNACLGLKHPWLFVPTLFCLIHYFRLFLGVWVNVLLAVYLALRPDRPDDRRLALAGLAAGGSGLFLQPWSQTLQLLDDNGGSHLVSAVFLYSVFGYISFQYALTLGASLLSLIRQAQQRSS